MVKPFRRNGSNVPPTTVASGLINKIYPRALCSNAQIIGDRLMRIGSTKFKDYITLLLIRFLILAKDRPPDNEGQNISRQEISIDLFIDAYGGNVASCGAV